MSDAHLNPAVKHDALLLFDAIDSNPNGDPDNAGKPRTDFDTQQGIASDASLKRKIRDAVEFQVSQGLLPPERNRIFIRRGVSLNSQLEDAYKSLNLEAEKGDRKGEADAAAYMKENYFDVRMFGAVMSTGKASAGKVTGPVTVGIARSYDAVLPMELAITRTASTTEDKKDNASQMGSKTVIPYGLYAARIHYQPTKDNMVTDEDLRVFWQTLATMFEISRSAARPDVNTRGLFVFSHDNALGNAPARTLLDSIKVQRAGESPETSPTRFEDYTIAEPTVLPPGVSYKRLI